MIYNSSGIAGIFGDHCDLVCCLKLGLLIRRYSEQGSNGQIGKRSLVLYITVQSIRKSFQFKKLLLDVLAS